MTKNVFLKILSVLFLSLVLFSCNKENELKPEATNDDAAVLQRILDFKADVTNPSNLKTGEFVSVEDAVWLVEAALNYDYYIQPKEDAYENMLTDSLFVPFESTENKILYSEVINLYTNLSCDLNNKLSAFDFAKKSIGMVDVEFINNTFKTYYFVDYTESATKSTCTECYDIYQNWYWGKGLGTANGNCIGYDASKVIFHNLYNQIIIPVEQRIVMTNITKKTFHYSAFNPSYPQLFGSNYLYLNSQLFSNNEYEPIIDYGSMVSLRDQTHNIWDYLVNPELSYVPAGKQYAGFCSLNSFYYFEIGNMPTHSYRTHEFDVWYGKPVYVSQDN